MSQNTQNADKKGTAVLSDKSLKRTAEENSDGDDDIWDTMDVVTSSIKRKRLQKGES